MNDYRIVAAGVEYTPEEYAALEHRVMTSVPCPACGAGVGEECSVYGPGHHSARTDQPQPVSTSVFVVLEDGWESTGIVGVYSDMGLAAAAVEAAQAIATGPGEGYRMHRALYIEEHEIRDDLSETL